MDAIETSLLYLSSRQRNDQGSNNADFEVTTPQSLHTASVVEVCPVQIGFPNLFNNVNEASNLGVHYHSKLITFATTTFLATYSASDTTGSYTPSALTISIVAGTYSLSHIVTYIQSHAGSLYGTLVTLNYNTATNSVDITINNQEGTYPLNFTQVAIDFATGLTSVTNLVPQYFIAAATNLPTTQSFTAVDGEIKALTINPGFYNDIQLLAVLNNDAVVGDAIWSINTDKKLILSPGTTSYTHLTIRKTNNHSLRIVDEVDFYNDHLVQAVTNVWDFGLLNFMPISTVFINVSNFCDGTLTHGGSGHQHNTLCAVPIGLYEHGKMVYWEPKDVQLARLRLPRSMGHDKVRITLLDDYMQPLLLDRHHHVDIVLKLYNSNFGQSTRKLPHF